MGYTPSTQVSHSKFMQPTLATSQMKGRREMMAGTLGLAAAAAERKALAEETETKKGKRLAEWQEFEASLKPRPLAGGLRFFAYSFLSNASVSLPHLLVS